MARIEKTVFISYRRADEPWGLAIFQDLTQHGYDVFIDYDGIASGNFEAVILENIRARAHFLVLLTPTALERCGDPKDWMRREIEAALDSQRNIVPVMLAGFDFGTPATASQLTGKLAALKEYNGLPIPKGYFSPAMERLRNKFLSVSLDTVLHPASLSAQQAATEQKDKATMALGNVLHQPWLSPEEPRKQEETAAQRRLAETEAEEALRHIEQQKVQRPSSAAARLISPGQGRMVAGSALALLLVGWIGLYQMGVPLWVPWTPRAEQPDAPGADKAKAAAEAAARAKAEQAEHERLAAAKAEERTAKTEAAEPLYRRAIEINEKALGKDHPTVARDYNNLALLLKEQGKYAEAEPLYRQAIEINERTLGKDNPELAIRYRNLALLLKKQGKYAEAEPLYRQAIEIDEKTFGKGHPTVANDYSNLAGVLQAQGKYAEAETLYRQAIEINEKALGKGHPTVANDYSNLAGVLRAQGK
jgi:tetratricopeptide (TPR) repeat protein